MFAFLKKLFAKRPVETTTQSENVVFGDNKLSLPRVGEVGVIYKTPDIDYVWVDNEYVPFQPYGEKPVVYKGVLVDRSGSYPGEGSPRTRIFYCLQALKDDIATISNMSGLNFEQFCKYGDLEKYGSIFNAYVHRQHPMLVKLLRSVFARNRSELLTALEAMGYPVWVRDNRATLLLDGHRITF